MRLCFHHVSALLAISLLVPIVRMLLFENIPVVVPVEYAGAYQPESFFRGPARSSGPTSGYVAAPAVSYPYRSAVNPWYQLVSPEVPILTLYPEGSGESFARTPCGDPYQRYILGGDPVTYGGPAAASPYAANQYAAASLANIAHGTNPNPYGNRVPYRLSPVPSVDYFRSNLISPSSPVPPASHYPLSRISALYPSSSLYVHPGSSKFIPHLAPSAFYTSDGVHI